MENLRDRRKVPVTAIHVRTGTVKQFPSIYAAAKLMKLSKCNISRCVHGHLKSYHDWRWERTLQALKAG